MKLKKRKSKGSSIMLVVVIFSILTIFGVSVLTLTLTAYKSRIVESNEKKSQYFSEGGIDIAYGIIGKTVDTAVEKGNEAVEDGMKDNSLLEDDGTLDEEEINKVFKASYQNYIKQNIKDLVQCRLKDENDKRIDNYGEVGEEGVKPQVVVTNNDNDINFIDDKLYISLLSTYKDKQGIEKKISVNYNIETPNYKESYYVERAKIPFQSVMSKALCADEELDLKGKNDVHGNIHVSAVNGNGGVNIQDGSSTVTGAISTLGSLNLLGNNSSIDVTGNVYSGNILIAGENTSFEAEDVYTTNDLQIDGKKSNTEIKRFYGINNENLKDAGTGKPKISSSILINSEDTENEDGSTVNITDEAIIMGVGYIATDPSYQTGESVAIKDNYIAYMQVLTGNEAKEKGLDEDSVYFEYSDPLTLVKGYTDPTSKEQKEMLLENKSDYFRLYSEEYSKDGKSNRLSLGKNNVNLPRSAESIISIGNIVTDGEIKKSSYDNEDESKIRTKQLIYGKRVYQMRDIDDSSIDYDKRQVNEETGYDEYRETYEVYKDGNNSQGIETVRKQINFKELKKVFLQPSSEDFIYLNNDDSKTCVLLGKNADTSLIEGYVEGDENSKYKTIRLENGKGNGIIVTKGDVYTLGNIDFKGTIVSGKSIKSLDSDKDGKKFTYDSAYVKRLMANNYLDFYNIFNQSSPDETAFTNINKDDNVQTDIVRDKLIHMKNWKLVK